MRYATAGIVTVAAAIIVGTGAPAGHPSKRIKTKSAAPAFLVRLTARVAANNCDSHPTGASYVRTTRRRAEAMSGDGVDSDPPVYLVLLRGRFIDYYAHGIYRTRDAFPRGTAITFTVDEKTHGILDFGIGGRAPDLTRLARVHDFTAELRVARETPSPPVCAG